MAQSPGEQQFKTKFQKQVLSFLLEKYERSQAFRTGQPSSQRPQFALKGSPFQKDYFDEMDFRKRVWMNDVLLELERQGLVSLAWAKFQEGSELAKVYLETDSMPKAYSLAGIKPKLAKMERMREILKPLSCHPWEWVKRWWQEADQKLAERSSGGLDLDDPEGYEGLVKVLLALTGIENTGKPKRLLSQELFRDSKYFERHVQKRLLSLLKKYGDTELETDEEYLDSIGIVDNPKSVWLSGALDCQVQGRTVATEGFFGGVGLSAETVKGMEIFSVRAERVVTIENLTSYHQWVQRRADRQELVVYIGGFPHRTLQIFLEKLAGYLQRHQPDMSVCHWGDIDLGGIRIFEYLKTNYFPQLRPILMDGATLMKYKDGAVPTDPAYLSKIKTMLEDPRYADWREVLRLMERYRIRIEQESVSDVPVQ
ncbi:Wadjet anti-phage system protein JetD domain-containing protein [Effusibacillus pohliae]|uniref:Wadjet anti-phage system protein JetD domain-containing protein n=1 Tax=Effusibacillus pohliae TaxID=232270 RepID=UPI000370CB58|nr:Wadjet anti-phage system protein JetD domain-containing protein [Effusibacillus pohliae]